MGRRPPIPYMTKRARLTGVREDFMLVGILVAGVIPAAAAATGLAALVPWPLQGGEL